jgi:hypothetical protein
MKSTWIFARISFLPCARRNRPTPASKTICSSIHTEELNGTGFRSKNYKASKWSPETSDAAKNAAVPRWRPSILRFLSLTLDRKILVAKIVLIQEEIFGHALLPRLIAGQLEGETFSSLFPHSFSRNDVSNSFVLLRAFQTRLRTEAPD